MKRISFLLTLALVLPALTSCKGGGKSTSVLEAVVESVYIDGMKMSVDGNVADIDPVRVRFDIRFSEAIDTGLVDSRKLFVLGADEGFEVVPSDDPQVLSIELRETLEPFRTYELWVVAGEYLGVIVPESLSYRFTTRLATEPQMPVISDEELLTLVQRQTFKYFWDYAHPVSGLARERLNSGDVVTSGGSGFGIMTIPVAIERGFITREEGVARVGKIVDFLSEKAERFHGAFSHWLNGSTGKAMPFSAKDNGADLVETAFLVQGLLTVQSYFSGEETEESELRTKIQALWEAVEWSWFERNGSGKLYWHWSPDYDWAMNMAISGWNEALIVYVLAASSPTYPISKEVYDKGWARNGAMRNGNKYYGETLPLGENLGGPLFFAHYSFLGLDPRGLSDAYADYWEQNRAHSLINHAYCAANPKNRYGYSDECWGLTASDIKDGYTASSPTNDVGVIAPTAALSSMPYTPEESMKALKFFYYILGPRLFSTYGFLDSFNLGQRWFASSYLAIDQGPIIVMIENHRTGLLWDTFTSRSDIRSGLTRLGFTYSSPTRK